MKEPTRAQESTNAIERLYITMRHLLNRGFYKPSGVSGRALRNALLVLRPEIYGSIAESKTELNGLIYVLERLPQGIEQCNYIHLTAEEGYKNSHITPIIPPKRRRNCYRIDDHQMNIEITRGRSDIYDILTHLTFLFIEAQKIYDRAFLQEDGSLVRDWEKVEAFLHDKKKTNPKREVALIHLSNILSRSYYEVTAVHQQLATEEFPDRLMSVIYWLGRRSYEENVDDAKTTIAFSPLLRERLGHHIHGEKWAETIKTILFKKGIINRPLHIISANMHSVLNTIYAGIALKDDPEAQATLELYQKLSLPENHKLQSRVTQFAAKNGMTFIKDESGANIGVQIFDTKEFTKNNSRYLLSNKVSEEDKPILLVMDYAFGEQAYETIDELLKPFDYNQNKLFLNVMSVSIMGKAGILQGGKGDIMIPEAHIFEGTADNYPFKNELKKSDFENNDLNVVSGSMVTVLGTSLQNKDILKFFHDSTWKVVGLEMEGAHYQKAIQSASKIRHSIREDVKVRYAYYASDNPLESGSTLASGGLGKTGVKPTYLITQKIVEQILIQDNELK